MSQQRKRRTPNDTLTLNLYIMIGFLLWCIFIDSSVSGMVVGAGFVTVVELVKWYMA